jgi:hypothetical protein
MPIGSILQRMLRRGTEQEASCPESSGLEGGIRAANEDVILAVHADLLRRIRIAYGGDEGSFEARLLPTIQRYAALVHLLPATADAHFREEGGLLRCGLEVGFHALQAADAQIFSAQGTVPERREMEPRWRTALFIAGLCAEVHRAVSAVVVTETGETDWSPLAGPLAPWLAEHRCERYQVRWTAPHPAAGLLLLHHVASPAVLRFIAEGDRAVLAQMLASLAGASPQGPSVLGEIVHRTLGLVVDRDLRRHAPAPSGLVTELVESDRDDPTSARTPAEPSPASSQSAAPAMSNDAPKDGAATHSEEKPTTGTGDVAPQAREGRVRQRELLLPATLNPLVAEALRGLLSGEGQRSEHSEVRATDEGIYVPLDALRQHGLDTGMVVRALHESRLLVSDRGQKIRRRRVNGSDELGVVLVPGILV